MRGRDFTLTWRGNPLTVAESNGEGALDAMAKSGDRVTAAEGVREGTV
jgi:hypothetical protein